jgi:hypothetical protein
MDLKTHRIEINFCVLCRYLSAEFSGVLLLWILPDSAVSEPVEPRLPISQRDSSFLREFPYEGSPVPVLAQVAFAQSLAHIQGESTSHLAGLVDKSTETRAQCFKCIALPVLLRAFLDQKHEPAVIEESSLIAVSGSRRMSRRSPRIELFYAIILSLLQSRKS